VIQSCLHNFQLSQFSLIFYLNMAFFVTFIFVHTRINETNLHWRLKLLEPNASFLANQSMKNLSSKIAAHAQLKAQLENKRTAFSVQSDNKIQYFASPVLPPRTRGRQVTQGAIAGVREQHRRRRRNVPRRASSDEEKPVEVMSRETNWPSASPTSTSRRSHHGGGAIAGFSPLCCWPPC
jgi:hypothetical protein